jgi:hypothetical protein
MNNTLQAVPTKTFPLIWLVQMKLPAMIKENKMKSTNIIIFINIWKAGRQWHECVFHTAQLAPVKILIQQGGKNSHLILSRDFRSSCKSFYSKMKYVLDRQMPGQLGVRIFTCTTFGFRHIII